MLIDLIELLFNVISFSCFLIWQYEIIGQVIAVETINAIPEEVIILISECRQFDVG